MRKLALVILLTAAGCRDQAPTPALPGTWTLVTAGGSPVPVEGVVSGSITFEDGGSYRATTCYATNPVSGACRARRDELGSFALSGSTLSLNTPDGYFRTLTIGGEELVQRNSGDTGGIELVYRK